jgi:hypothetical protein
MSARWSFVCVALTVACGSVAAMQVQEYQSGIVWPKPPVVTPGEGRQPPSDAIVLFGGENLDAWEGGRRWIVEDGVATAARRDIQTRQAFGDCQLHLEFATPAEVRGSGQGRGNSGVYLMGRYEVQILDSYENETYYDGQCGAIYKQQPPTVNASRPPGEWQSLDILFTAPRFADDGSLVSPAYVTVLHNGVLIHNHYELQGSTSYTEAARYTAHAEKEPISLQFHGNPVRFRNIWIRENVQPLVGLKPEIQTPPHQAETERR